MKRAVIGIACGLVLMNTVGCIVVASKDGLHPIKEIQQQESAQAELQRKNREKIAVLELATGYQDVINVIGVPNFSEQFVQDGESYQTLYYFTHGNPHHQSKENCTPLIFKDKKLISWGNTALSELQQASMHGEPAQQATAEE